MQDNSNAHRLWFFPFAAEVLWIERNMSEKHQATNRTGKADGTDIEMMKVEDISECAVFLQVVCLCAVEVL